MLLQLTTHALIKSELIFFFEIMFLRKSWNLEMDQNKKYLSKKYFNFLKVQL
jgi:hypothetical protein